MNSDMAKVARRSNPFATKFIRAGKLPFQFADDQTTDRLHQRLQNAGWFGQIVGPHGSGKTTLLRSLDPYWSAWGRRPLLCELRDRKRMNTWKKITSQASAGDVIVVDGYEQLGTFAKCSLLLRCRLQGCGLLATTHQKCPLLHVVYQTQTSLRLARDLVERLLPAELPSLELSIPQHFGDHAGNMRETFLSLYDEYAKRQSKSPNCC